MRLPLPGVVESAVDLVAVAVAVFAGFEVRRRRLVPLGLDTLKHASCLSCNEQERLLPAGRFDFVNVEHIAVEPEEAGKSEQRQLESCMVVFVGR